MVVFKGVVYLTEKNKNKVENSWYCKKSGVLLFISRGRSEVGWNVRSLNRRIVGKNEVKGRKVESEIYRGGV